MQTCILISMGCLWIQAPLAAAENPNWLPVQIHTHLGSRFRGWLRIESPSLPSSLDQAANPPAWTTIREIIPAEGPDPELLKQAQAAVEKLKSNDYAVRQTGLKTLRALGGAALAALRSAALSTETEVAMQARQIMGEWQATGSSDSPSDDEVHLKSGQIRHGQINLAHLSVATSLGFLKISMARIARIEFRDVKDTQAYEDIPRPDKDEQPLAIQPVPPSPYETPVHRISLDKEVGDQPNGMRARISKEMLLRDLERINFDSEKLAEGEEIDKKYADRGILFSAIGKGQKVIASKTHPLNGLSKEFLIKASSEQSDHIEISFCQPGANPELKPDSNPTGSLLVAFLVPRAEAGSYVVEAFDGRGRRISRLYSQGEEAENIFDLAEIELLGLRSKVPISRIRISRTESEKAPPLRLDDLFYSRVISRNHPTWLSAIEYKNKDRFVGSLTDAADSKGLAFKAALAPEHAPARVITPQDIIRIDPARDTQMDQDAQKSAPTPHAVLLQNGERFRTCLIKLDQNQVLLRLAGQVEVALPRTALRKVDLWPDIEKAKEGQSHPIEVGKDEKPGVEFRGTNPQIAENKKKEEGSTGGEAKAPAPAEGLPRMDNAEILKVDLEEESLVVDPKDGGGAWPIDLLSVRYLVFPPVKEEIQNLAPGESWTLTLHQGSRFKIKVKSFTLKSLVGEMAGGSTSLPWRTIETLSKD